MRSLTRPPFDSSHPPHPPALWTGIGPDVDLGAGVGKSTKRAAQGGLHAWHWGVGLKAGKACREAARSRGADGSQLGERLQRAGGQATWAGIKGLHFQSGGTLSTPWGGGTWGRMRLGGGGEDLLYADFIGQQHMVRAHADGWPKLMSMRCADFENVTIVVAE